MSPLPKRRKQGNFAKLCSAALAARRNSARTQARGAVYSCKSASHHGLQPRLTSVILNEAMRVSSFG
jgi:hypothetical protein